MHPSRFVPLLTAVVLAGSPHPGAAAAAAATNATPTLQRRVIGNLLRGNATGAATATPAAQVSPAQTVPAQLTPATTRATPVRTPRTNSTATAATVATGAGTTAAAEPPDLASAIRTMNFDRTPEALFDTVKAQQAGTKLTETERFRLAVLLGDWAAVGTALKALPPAEAMAGYTRLLDSLAQNSQSAAQFFNRSGSASRSTATRTASDTGTPSRADKRVLFLSEDFYAVLAAAPGSLTNTHLPAVGALVKVAIGSAGRQDFLARLAKGLQGIGGTTPGGTKLAAQLLSSVGWMSDAGPYLPLQREQWDTADTLTLVLTMEFFTQTGVDQKDERQLKRAAELCAFMMQTSRFGANERGIFRQATDRFVKLLPALEADDAEDLIRENFLTQPELMIDLLLALGESGQQAQRGTDLNLRGQSLATQHLLLRVLEGKKSALPDAVNVLIVNWLGEAEQTYRGGTANPNGDDSDSPLLFRAVLGTTSTARRDARTLSPEVILSRAPSAALTKRLNPGLAQRVNLTSLKVSLINPKEPVTLETLKGYVKEHPGQEKELCQDYLIAWVRRRTVPAEDPNIVRLRALGYEIARPAASGIPLTRLRQNQNITDFKNLLATLRSLSPEPIDANLVVQSFMSIHSGAEVYRLEDIETIFGPPEKMPRAELMNLVTGMRSKLREQWRDPARQQESGSNRTEEELKDEVSRGYRTALELVRRGLRAEDAEWKQFIVRGQLFFDASEYEFARQIKLTDYVSLRDEAFTSYRRAAEIYAAKLARMPRGQWTMEPYQMWFFVMLGASDLAQLTHVAARSDPGLKSIGDAMRALPGEAAEGHQKLFGQMLGDTLSQVPANMRQRFLSAGLQVIGADHPSARPAVDALRNYQELLDEVQLRLTVDGPTRVGHTQPFGAFISLEHTRQLAREGGGFTKYLQAPNANSRSMLLGGGSKSPNHREEFGKNIHAALDETFEVASITFHDASVKPIDLPREGWQETPFAYVVLRAKDAAVDRIPSIQLDMDFSDTAGQVVLPVRTQVQPVDARDATVPLRPATNLAVSFTMDEREWRDGKIVVEIAVRGQGVLPSHTEMFDFNQPGFDVTVNDHGLSVGQFVSSGRDKTAQSDRSWQFNYQRKSDARGDVVFHFPKLIGGIQTTNVEYKHYQDADLVTVSAAEALAGVPLHRAANTGLKLGLGAALLAGVLALVWAWRRRQGSVATAGAAPLQLPAQITPFSVVAFLRRIQRDHAGRLDDPSMGALQTQIRELENAYFRASPPAASGSDLESIARRWLQTVG